MESLRKICDMKWNIFLTIFLLIEVCNAFYTTGWSPRSRRGLFLAPFNSILGKFGVGASGYPSNVNYYPESPENCDQPDHFHKYHYHYHTNNQFGGSQNAYPSVPPPHHYPPPPHYPESPYHPHPSHPQPTYPHYPKPPHSHFPEHPHFPHPSPQYPHPPQQPYPQKPHQGSYQPPTKPVPVSGQQPTQEPVGVVPQTGSNFGVQQPAENPNLAFPTGTSSLAGGQQPSGNENPSSGFPTDSSSSSGGQQTSESQNPNGFPAAGEQTSETFSFGVQQPGETLTTNQDINNSQNLFPAESNGVTNVSGTSTDSNREALDSVFPPNPETDVGGNGQLDVRFGQRLNTTRRVVG